ncbi:MAG: hypothetical protein WD599_00510 [Balneolaceae bacterium]
MTDRKSVFQLNRRKKWIVLLLSVSCLVSIFLYLSYQPAGNLQLKNTGQVDSLITRLFDRFNISAEQIRKRPIRIDTLTARVVYTVNVPPGFSKTRWHFELDKEVREYGIQTPARVTFPEQSMQIHLTYGTNIIRSVLFRTDPDLVLYRDYASLILVFDQPPAPSELDRIIAFGEPIHLAIRSDIPRQDYPSLQEIRRKYSRTLWMLQENDGGNFNQSETINPFLNHAARIHQIDPGASILFFNPYPENLPPVIESQMSKFDLYFIEVGEALYIEDLADGINIRQITNQLLSKSSVSNPPVLIVEGSSANIQRLQEFIMRLKEYNIQLRNPATYSF